MHSKRPLLTLLAAAFTLAMLLAACESPAKPSDLEEMISSNEEVADVLKQDEASGISVDVSGNDVTYTYDISNMEGLPSDIKDNEELKKSFESSIDSQASAFESTCRSLEEKSGISGITITVVYAYDGEAFVSRTFTSESSSDSSSEASSDDGTDSDDSTKDDDQSEDND